MQTNETRMLVESHVHEVSTIDENLADSWYEPVDVKAIAGESAYQAMLEALENFSKD